METPAGKDDPDREEANVVVLEAVAIEKEENGGRTGADVGFAKNGIKVGKRTADGKPGAAGTTGVDIVDVKLM